MYHTANNPPLRRGLLSCLPFFVLCLALLLPLTAKAAYAVVVADQGDELTYFWARNFASVAKAKSAALERCKAASKKNPQITLCRDGLSGEGPVFVAIVLTENRSFAGLAAAPFGQDAIAQAQELCEGLNQGPCDVASAHSFIDIGPLAHTQPKPGPQPVKTALPASPGKVCQPPTGGVLRYSDRCFNGDCTRTFENGFTRRFQAPYCYDSLRGEWAFKPDGC